MKAIESRRMRNAVLVVLFLLGGAALVTLYLNGSGFPGSNFIIAGDRPVGVRPGLVEVPLFPLVPARFLHKNAVSISQERNAGVLKSVFEVFNPSLRSFLASVPIVVDSSADTAKAYRSKGYIGVSPDWDNTVLQSKYRAIYEQRGMKPGDPVFRHRFKTDLLIHEFLHILQFHLRIDPRLCYEAVARWYLDPRYGVPSPGGTVYAGTAKGRRPVTLAINRMKYIVWHELYDYRGLNNVPQDEGWKDMRYEKRYRWSEKGVEEFAYIGQEILSTGSTSENYSKTGQWCDEDWKNKKMRLREVSPEVLAVYRGIFNPALTR